MNDQLLQTQPKALIFTPDSLKQPRQTFKNRVPTETNTTAYHCPAPNWGTGSSAQAAHAPDRAGHSINRHLELPLHRAEAARSPRACSAPAPASLRPTGRGAQVRRGFRRRGHTQRRVTMALPETRGRQLTRQPEEHRQGSCSQPQLRSQSNLPIRHLPAPQHHAHVKAGLTAARFNGRYISPFPILYLYKNRLFGFGCAGLRCCKAFLQLQRAGAALAAVGTGFSP